MSTRFAIFSFFVIASGDDLSGKSIPSVVEGFSIDISLATYQVSKRKKGGHMCGTRIYSDHVIITAAHCLYLERSQWLTVAAGSTTRVPMFGQEIRVA